MNASTGCPRPGSLSREANVDLRNRTVRSYALMRSGFDMFPNAGTAAAVFFAILGALSACLSSSAPAPQFSASTPTAAEVTCRAKSDCSPDLECVFTVPGCTEARGTCTRIARTQLDEHHSFPRCASLPGGSPRCMCDGKEVATSCPAFAPFAREGACAPERGP